MMHNKVIIGVLICLGFAHFANAQVKLPDAPQPAGFKDYTQTVNPNTQSKAPYADYYNPDLSPEERNNLIIQGDLEAYEKQQRSEKINEEARLIAKNRIRYRLPKVKAPETEYFNQAYSELHAMLEGEKPMDLKRAVFITENAFLENRMDYSKYEQTLQNIAHFCRLALEQEGHEASNPLAVQMMLYRFMSDTLSVRLPQEEQPFTTFPMQYDFEDFRGIKDPTKLFVSKLMTTTSGQCHSLPLLYLSLCQMMGAEASMALAPEHSYVMLKDPRGNWFNLELTNGVIASDEFIMQSGYIKAAAIKSGIFMRPMDTREIVAQCVSDLALYYSRKYGYDDFQLKCAELVKKHQKSPHRALILEANYYTLLLNYVVNQYRERRATPAQANADAKAKALLEQRNERYQQIEQLGYETMPEEAYAKWLNSLQQAKAKQESQKHLLKINSLLEK